METAEGAGGAGHPPEHYTNAAAVTTENGKHMRREYDMVALEVLLGGQASAGPAPEEDGHGATQQRRASSEQEPVNGETEERAPPERSRAPNVSGQQGGEGGGGSPTQQRAPMARSEG